MFEETTALCHEDDLDEVDKRLDEIRLAMRNRRTKLLVASANGDHIHPAELAEMLAHYDDTTEGWLDLQSTYRQRVGWAAQIDGLDMRQFSGDGDTQQQVAIRDLIRTASNKSQEYIRYLQDRVVEVIGRKQQYADEITELKRELCIEQPRHGPDMDKIRDLESRVSEAQKRIAREDEWLWVWSKNFAKSYERMLDPADV